jgi:hypothetical protein
MMHLFLKAMTHKYLRRWRGRNGEWEYAYTEAQERERKEKPESAHRGTLRGVTEKEVREVLKKFARRPKGMGEEKTIQTKRQLGIILGQTTFALMSAGRNPNDPEDMKLSDKQVKERYAQLLSDLKEEGYMYTQCRGKYVNPEESVMVMAHDADRENVISLGEKYKQESIVFCSHGKNQLIYSTGKNKGKVTMAGSGYADVPDATDYYTKLPLSTGENIKFTMSLEDIAKAIRLFIVNRLNKAKWMPVGSVSNGHKKVAEGKWVDIPENDSPADLMNQMKMASKRLAELKKMPKRKGWKNDSKSVWEWRKAVRQATDELDHIRYKHSKATGAGGEEYEVEY